MQLVKGQLISKKIVEPRILQKNEQMNSFLLVCNVFSLVFWANPRPEKKCFEITWPLVEAGVNFWLPMLLIEYKFD